MVSRVNGRRIVSYFSTALFVIFCVFFVAVASGCSEDDASDAAAASPSETQTETETATLAMAQTARPSGGELTIDRFHEGVYCDESERPAVMILGASPGETITFTSPMPVDVADGIADDRGTYQLNWACESVEASLSWQLTATGSTSGRTITFLVNGSYVDPDDARQMIFYPASDPLVCNDTRQIVGRLENAAPNEIVEFISPNANGIRAGTADGLGSLEVGWSCDLASSETTWEVRVVGQTSNRTAAFTLIGLPPQPLEAGPIVVELTEDPFVCNRERRKVVKLSNLTPDVNVRFTPNSGSGDGLSMRSGKADEFGVLDVYWQCNRGDAGTNWQLTAEENNPYSTDDKPRSITFTITGTASGAVAGIDVTEDPFVCDGSSHQYAVLSNFVSREFVDFSSPQTSGIRQGQADGNGDLPIRWQCDPAEAGSTWEVTATGATSGLELTFTITGAAAP